MLPDAMKADDPSPTPAEGVLPYGRQWIAQAEIDVVVRSLRSDFLTCGPLVSEFETRFAEMVGARHAIAMNSATAALHVAMLVARIGRGDRVVTSPNTFLASANCAAFVGATPDFCDIDPAAYNLDADLLKRTWRPDTKAVVAVAYAGQPCDMPRIASIARDRGAIVIEDACHGIGGGFRHEGRDYRLGGHPWADMTTFSFHPVKTMTTGEGGMLVTDRDDWAEEARRLRAHGVERQRFEGLGDGLPAAFNERGPWYYEMQDLGFNYRITDLQCALGLAQLERLPDFIARRQQIVAKYNRAFAGMPNLITPALRCESDRDLTSWHLYTVQIEFAALGRTRTEVMADLRRHRVGSQVLYIPVHLQPWYRRSYGYALGKCPVAERYYERALSLPLFPAMSDEDADRVVSAVHSVLAP